MISDLLNILLPFNDEESRLVPMLPVFQAISKTESELSLKGRTRDRLKEVLF